MCCSFAGTGLCWFSMPGSYHTELWLLSFFHTNLATTSHSNLTLQMDCDTIAQEIYGNRKRCKSSEVGCLWVHPWCTSRHQRKKLLLKPLSLRFKVTPVLSQLPVGLKSWETLHCTHCSRSASPGVFISWWFVFLVMALELVTRIPEA